jgi:hypothetical protein
MSNHILIFSDNKGNERFFLRRRSTTADLQRWLACLAASGKADTPWASLRLEDVPSTRGLCQTAKI